MDRTSMENRPKRIGTSCTLASIGRQWRNAPKRIRKSYTLASIGYRWRNAPKRIRKSYTLASIGYRWRNAQENQEIVHTRIDRISMAIWPQRIRKSVTVASIGYHWRYGPKELGNRSQSHGAGLSGEITPKRMSQLLHTSSDSV